ncbi:putative bifunctional diguanylate cyclase/phosphodiesterase [Dysosmobacter sp. Sow4_B12]|uniref:putative bifunctional diguanylate cyclase/phosphodiesterase n=1 Tax=Dysosmobacter sp. Sow4_B12 TaxID=3438777 RepID=UPI003F9108B1
MVRWSLMGEYLSLLIIGIIFIRYYCYEGSVVFSLKKKIFLGCLLSAAASIFLNILTVLTISNPGCIPLWLGILLNSGYFVVVGGACTLFALFMFLLTLEHVYDRHCMKMACTVLLVLFSLYLLAMVVNLFNGCLFYYDAVEQYQRGPLNRIVFLLPIMQLVFLGYCYIRNRSSVGTSMVYVMWTMPPIVLLLSLFQVFYPDFLLNGTISAFVSLILFLSFQTHTGDRDSLTGIRNRNSFMTELSLRVRSRQHIQILVVSLLSFSDVNLQHGHTLGDAVLYETARYLDQMFPQGHAFRTGNVTFAIMLPWLDDETAHQHLQQVRDRFRSPWVLGEVSCHLHCCIADLCYDGGDATAMEVVEQLEYTLEQAKEERGIVRFDETIRLQMRRKQEIIDIIRRSIQERRFRVWYQPIYCCHDDIFCSAEALLRLNDYEGKPIPPDVFIPLAEETGMIGELTWIVLEEICRLLSSGQVPGLKTVSLNLSMQQLLDPGLADRIQRYLTEYQLSPDCLKVEITERFLLHDALYAKRQLASLAAIGIQIYMDDFGTGYSNLSSVLDYPFAFIKLDRSLVIHVPEDHRAELMLRTLLTLFHSLGKRVVVEGVESKALADYLKHCGSDMIQGFYYAAPMAKEELIAFFSQKNHPENRKMDA